MRNWLTMIIMPSKSAMASRSMALSASERLNDPRPIIRLAPTSAVPAQSIRNPGAGRAPLPHRSKRRQQPWRPSASRLTQGSWGECSSRILGDRRLEAALPASNKASALPAEAGKARVNDYEPSQRRAKRRANALRGNHGSLGQIEMAGAARQIRDNERKKRAIKPRSHAVETLHREQPKAMVSISQSGKKERLSAPSIGLVTDRERPSAP